VLADHRLTIYGAGRRVAVQDDAARWAFVESRYALIEETATAGALDTLAAAYTAARDRAAAARIGDTDTANERWDTATRRRAPYLGFTTARRPVAARERASDAERVVPLARSLELSVSNLPDNRVQMVVDTD
jgi:hypothetical protein